MIMVTYTKINGHVIVCEGRKLIIAGINRSAAISIPQFRGFKCKQSLYAVSQSANAVQLSMVLSSTDCWAKTIQMQM